MVEHSDKFDQPMINGIGTKNHKRFGVLRVISWYKKRDQTLKIGGTRYGRYNIHHYKKRIQEKQFLKCAGQRILLDEAHQIRNYKSQTSIQNKKIDLNYC